MTTIRAFKADDLFKFNHINLDALTETYNVGFYAQCNFMEDFEGFTF